MDETLKQIQELNSHIEALVFELAKSNLNVVKLDEQNKEYVQEITKLKSKVDELTKSIKKCEGVLVKQGVSSPGDMAVLSELRRALNDVNK